MTHLLRIILLCLVAHCAIAAETASTAAVREVLAVQKDAWNRGDIDGFMKGYLRSDDIRFASGENFKYGWQATLDGYRQGYPDSAAMGKLGFELVEVRELGPDVVYVFGKWHLARANKATDKAPHGLFTLIVEHRNGAWLITRDHTSAAGG
jgi:uncharacterized protein (TIGR02246 family)